MPIRILLVDDHEILRQGLRVLLESYPEMQVVGGARDGKSAVQMVKELSPDVVVMDVRMPDLNGIDATRQILACQENVKVIALSAQADGQSTSEMLRAGAAAYVLKDAAFEELAMAINIVMAGKMFLSPAVAGTLVKGYLSGESSGRSIAFSALSVREREVLQLMAEGKTTKEIALLLYVSAKTVETHRRHIMTKVGIDSVAGLTRYAIREGITTL